MTSIMSLDLTAKDRDSLSTFMLGSRLKASCREWTAPDDQPPLSSQSTGCEGRLPNRCMTLSAK